MRVVEMESQRLTVYVPEGLRDRLALTRIPGLQHGFIPLLAIGDGWVHVRTWDGRKLGEKAVFFR